MNIKFVEVQCIGNTNQININSAKDLVDLLCYTLCVSPLGYRLHNLAEDIRAAAAKETTELDSESISSPDGRLENFREDVFKSEKGIMSKCTTSAATRLLNKIAAT